MKHVLITGGCGFVGSSLAIDLAARGYRVTVLDNLSRHGSEILLQRVLAAGIQFVRADVRDRDALNGLGGTFDLMLMCSAEPSALAGAQGNMARYLLDVNLQGSINCFEWARERQVAVIFVSSSRIYPYDSLNSCSYKETTTRFEFVEGCAGVSARGVAVDMPLQGVRSLYGASKFAAELILREYAVQYGLPAVINRCGVISGPWQLGKAEQGVFAFWLASHYYKRPINYIGFGGCGKQVRDLLHIQDLADLVAQQAQMLLDKPLSCRGSVFNVGGSVGANLSLLETTAICEELTGNRIGIGSVLQERPADLIWYITDNGATEDVFCWKPRRSARNIFEDMLHWFRENEDDCRKIFG